MPRARKIALSGGCFQNAALLQKTLARLEANGGATKVDIADDLPLFAAAAAREPEAKDELREALQALAEHYTGRGIELVDAARLEQLAA